MGIYTKIDKKICSACADISDIQDIICSAEELKNNSTMQYFVSHLDSVKELLYSYIDLILNEIEKCK